MHGLYLYQPRTPGIAKADSLTHPVLEEYEHQEKRRQDLVQEMLEEDRYLRSTSMIFVNLLITDTSIA